MTCLLLGRFSYACEGVQGTKDARKSAQDTFVIRGFETWKLATTVVCQHKLRVFHKEAVERVITLIVATTDIGVATSCSDFFCYQ